MVPSLSLIILRHLRRWVVQVLRFLDRGQRPFPDVGADPDALLQRPRSLLNQLFFFFFGYMFKS